MRDTEKEGVRERDGDRERESSIVLGLVLSYFLLTSTTQGNLYMTDRSKLQIVRARISKCVLRSIVL
jgi:hypothetical protein